MKEKILNAFRNINAREKRVLIAGGVVVALILGYGAFDQVFGALSETRERAEELRRELRLNAHKLKQRDKLERKAREVDEKELTIKERLFPGDSATIAAGELQRTVQEIADRLQVSVDQFSASPSPQKGTFVELLCQTRITVNMTQLTAFLSAVELEEKRLMRVPKARLRVLNVREPDGRVKVDMTITGYYGPPPSADTTAAAPADAAAEDRSPRDRRAPESED
ncbi:MAG: hypothetical protein HYV63_00360 [Candidatus Schekmanbacteria bacterium]|nr:hypothetical protein [Candidatus Schekmanbacteria bacterium]